MRLLVDGMNVIGARPDGWWRDRQGAMRRLVDELERFAGDRDTDVTVVFDIPLRDPPAGRVRVLSASRRGRDAADDEIARLVAEDAEPSSLCVITSDGALAERVRAAGARVEGAGAFRARLSGRPG